MLPPPYNFDFEMLTCVASFGEKSKNEFPLDSWSGLEEQGLGFKWSWRVKAHCSRNQSMSVRQTRSFYLYPLHR